jgi:hypothetical protein
MQAFDERWAGVDEEDQRAFYDAVMERPLSAEEIAELGFDPVRLDL